MGCERKIEGLGDLGPAAGRAATTAAERKFAAAWPPEAWQDVTVVAAVSGGADSVALLRAMVALKAGGAGRLVAAHLNHQLRPEAADDEAFVGALCRGLGVPCETVRADVGAMPSGGEGLEATARQARYDFLQQAAARCGARYVVTAHTADDQAETVLHRILRGTGVRGLAGMARARPLGHATLLRPLLGFRRQELVAYLEELGQPYRNDSSNDDPRFTRNRIRRELLPQLAEQYNPGVVESLVRLAAVAGETQQVVDLLAADLCERCVRRESPRVSIDVSRLAGQPRAMIRELMMLLWRQEQWPMQAMGFDQWDRLAAIDVPGKITLPGNVLAETSGGRMTLERLT